VKNTCRFFPTIEEQHLCEDQCRDIAHAGYCKLSCASNTYSKCLKEHCQPDKEASGRGRGDDEDEEEEP
jgi:hypothetical protein